MPKQAKWRAAQDPLFRGDKKERGCEPQLDADTSLVRHILFLEGSGRETPYLSCTEQEEVAEMFAGENGAVWITMLRKAKSLGVGHISKAELLTLLMRKREREVRMGKPVRGYASAALCRTIVRVSF